MESKSESNREELKFTMERLQSELSAMPKRGRGHKYGKTIKALAVEVMGYGISPQKLETLTGINPSTSADWKTASKKTRFRSVKIKQDQRPPQMTELFIETRTGLKIKGLTTESLIELLKRGEL